MKANLQHQLLFNNMKLYSHTQPTKSPLRSQTTHKATSRLGLMKENLSERLSVEPAQVMGSKLTKMKANSHYSTIQSCTAAHNQLLVGQDSIKVPDYS